MAFSLFMLKLKLAQIFFFFFSSAPLVGLLRGLMKMSGLNCSAQLFELPMTSPLLVHKSLPAGPVSLDSGISRFG